jgi:hypothetical protein
MSSLYLRLLLVAAALVATVLASEDAFLDFTKQFGKRYSKATEMVTRRYDSSGNVLSVFISPIEKAEMLL